MFACQDGTWDDERKRSAGRRRSMMPRPAAEVRARRVMPQRFEAKGSLRGLDLEREDLVRAERDRDAVLPGRLARLPAVLEEVRSPDRPHGDAEGERLLDGSVGQVAEAHDDRLPQVVRLERAHARESGRRGDEPQASGDVSVDDALLRERRNSVASGERLDACREVVATERHDGVLEAV